uniref:beta-lactamase n=1 Tax=Phenylobacterium glaciei TaxID=2803784 RepID=A0A974S7J5_9CAUL|nr:serine hydrolase [Phenylobacterium glaciei]
MMLTISDNAATDLLIARVGLDAINARAVMCGCRETRIVSDLKTLLDTMAVDLAFRSYAELLNAQAGKLGPAAQAGSTDPARIAAIAALDPARGSRTTARDMTTLLAAVWNDTAALPPACATLRDVMGQQVTRRLEPAMPDGDRWRPRAAACSAACATRSASSPGPTARATFSPSSRRRTSPSSGPPPSTRRWRGR